MSVADVQWVLQNFSDAGGELAVEVGRGTQKIALGMSLPKLWRRVGDFGWRYRVAGYAMWLWSGATFVDHPQGMRVENLSPGWFKQPNRNARRALRRGDVVVEVDGERGWTRSTYTAYLMREKELGSTVRLRVVRGGKTIDVQFKLPSVQPEVY